MSSSPDFLLLSCRLENPDDAETKAFVDAQNEVTQKFLSECESREKFRERMTALYNYPKYGTPFRRGSKYFYFKNTGLQAQSVLYMVVSGHVLTGARKLCHYKLQESLSAQFWTSSFQFFMYQKKPVNSVASAGRGFSIAGPHPQAHGNGASVVLLMISHH